MLNKWQQAEITFWILFGILVYVKWLGLGYPYQNESIFITGVTLMITYLFRIFGSFSLWKKSKGLILVRGLFYMHAYTIITGLINYILNWQYSIELIYYSYAIFAFGLAMTGFHYLVSGRNKHNLVVEVAQPLLIRGTLLFFIASLFLLSLVFL